MTEGKRSVNVNEVLLRYGWLLPFYWALSRGPSSVGGVARDLGVNRRIASTGVYYLSRLGLAEKSSDGKYRLKVQGGPDVKRRGRLFAAIIGGTVVVAKIRGRSVKTYTVPLKDVENPPEKGKRGYRARVARYVLGYDEGSGGASP